MKRKAVLFFVSIQCIFCAKSNSQSFDIFSGLFKHIKGFNVWWAPGLGSFAPRQGFSIKYGPFSWHDSTSYLQVEKIETDVQLLPLGRISTSTVKRAVRSPLTIDKSELLLLQGDTIQFDDDSKEAQLKLINKIRSFIDDSTAIIDISRQEDTSNLCKDDSCNIGHKSSIKYSLVDFPRKTDSGFSHWSLLTHS